MTIPSWLPGFAMLDNILCTDKFTQFTDELQDAVLSKTPIILLGDGIYGGIAHSLAGDFSTKLSLQGFSPRIITPFSNLTFISAVSSASEFDYSYSLFLRNHLEKKNLVIFLSDSGNSINLVRFSQLLIKFSDAFPSTSWNMCGYSGGSLLNSTSNTFLVNSDVFDSIPALQFYLLSKALNQTLVNISQMEESELSPTFMPIESNRAYNRTTQNQIV